ncbi:MAG: FAD-binding protein [Deltaproteobacteria bacterium]|nr:FAD-binding protein [Deltaproteobacteria bacterium]
MELAETIRGIVGIPNVIEERAERLCYSRDMSVHEGVPDLIVYAENTDQVSRIMKAANERSIPVTARGSGTSVTGAVLPTQGGILLDLSSMNRILEISPENFYVRLEPGVICGKLNEELAKYRMFFPPDPGSSAIATLGGMVSTNASGLRAVKYGTTKEYIKGLEVVLADGTVIHTGTRAPKSATGYDLTHLFVNSEGTLGIVTEIMVKIEPLPEYVAFAMALFENLDDAGMAVKHILTSGIPLCAGEIMDRESIRVVRNAMKMDIPDIEAMLIMEVDGHKEAVKEQMDAIKRICGEHHGLQVRWSDDPQERGMMWRGRAGLVPALSRIKPGYRLVPISEDFGVPIDRIPEMIRGAQEVAKKYDVMIATFGHVGDGNIHTTFVIDLTDPKHWERLKPAALELVELSFQMNGTISAEHGTGLTRAPFIAREMGESFHVMETLKQAMDPKNILNPGKMGFDRGVDDVYNHFAFGSLMKGRQGFQSFGTFEDDEILACVQCGFCRNGCPTFSVSKRESRNARGRNILAYHMMTGRLEPSQELADTFFRCTTCGTCTYYCPAQIKVPEIVKKCRDRLAESGFLPSSYRAVLDSIERTGNPFGSSREERISVYPSAVRKAIQENRFPEKADTLLFMGCVPSYVDMKIVPSFIQNIERAGIDFTSFATNENCCGLPLYLSGSGEFEGFARRQIEKINAVGAGTMVTPCAGCYHSFKDLYAKVGGLEPALIHAVQYLEQLLDSGRLQFSTSVPQRVTYHDPCDLGRRLGIFEAPRNILKKIPELEFVEMERNRLKSRCCGAGGGVSAVDPEMSLAMAKERVKDALNVGAAILVSACASCKDNLRKGLNEYPKEDRKRLKIMDINEIVAKALGK